MEIRRFKFGFTGIAFGAVALLLALTHFHSGPFAPPPTLEQTVAEQAVAIRNATMAALEGREVRPSARDRGMNVDEILISTVAVLGGLALVLGVVGHARKEPIRVTGGAAILGGGALAFQLIVMSLE